MIIMFASLTLLLSSPLWFVAYILHKRGMLFPRLFSIETRMLQQQRPSFTAEIICIGRAVSSEFGECDDRFSFEILDCGMRKFCFPS